MGKHRKRKSKPRKVAPSTHKAGRPLRLNVTMIEKAARLYARGNFTNHVASMCGVSQKSFERWIKAGAEAVEAEDDGAVLTGNDVLYARFSREVEKAQANGIDEYLGVVRDVADQDESPAAKLSAAKFFLSVADSRYSERSRTEVSGPDGGAVKLEVGGSMGEAIEQALAEVPGLVLDGGDDDE